MEHDRTIEEPKSVEVKIWLESDGSICLTGPGFGQPPVRIKNDPARPSGHPRLYKHLTQYLRQDEPQDLNQSGR